MNKLIGIFAPVGTDEKVVNYGPELVDWAVANDVGLAWWDLAAANWSGDNVKIISNGGTGDLAKWGLLNGKMFLLEIIVNIVSGDLLVVRNGVDYININNGLNKVILTGNNLYFSGIVLDAQILRMSIKQIFEYEE